MRPFCSAPGKPSKRNRMAEELFEDDGTLACLHIPADRTNKRFACKEERQDNLIGKTFWLLDYFADVQTRFGSRHLYKAAFEKDAPDSACFKVFTGSSDCAYILEQLGEMQKFPRRVTLKKEGKNHYFFE